MPVKRKLNLIGLVTGLFIVILAVAMYVYPRLGIATGFAAKAMCSCHFLGGRQPEEISTGVLYHNILPWVSIKMQVDKKSVSASFLGMQKKTARYKDEAGCMLVPEGQTAGFMFSRDDAIFGPDSLAGKFTWTESATRGLDKDKLDKVLAGYFDADHRQQKLRTTAALVIHRDTLVAEKYLPPFDKDKTQLGWSMTKSLMNAFVGLMVQNGKLDPSNNNLFAAWRNDNRKNISLHHLLQMNSGLEWEEDYTKVSDVTRMLYDSPDVSTIPVSKQMKGKPGKDWLYSSGNTNLISKYIRDVFSNDEAYHGYLYRRLAMPLGMSSLVLETDATGHFIGSSYAFATPRDWAKFGLLYLHDGVWMGKRLLPDYWVKYTTTPAEGSDGKYGAHFWLNHHHSHFPDIPEDMFFADGYQGQRIFIIPSMELVIVRMGAGDHDFDTRDFLIKILDCFGK